MKASCRCPVSFPSLVHSQIHLFTHLPDQMPVNILISPYAQRIKTFHDTNKIIKSGISFPKFGRCQRMRFSPVRATIVPNGDRFKSIEIFVVWGWKPIWFKLHKANPTSHPAKSRTKPYVVSRCDADFDGKMRTNAVWFFIFILEILVEFGQ